MGRLNFLLPLVCVLLFAGVAFANSVSKTLAERGKNALQEKNYAAAKKSCEEAIVADPADGAGFACLGRSFAKLGNGKTAERYYEIALRLKPTLINALVWSALRDLSNRRPDKARTKLKKLEKTCGNCQESQKLRAALTKYTARKNAAKSKQK